MTLRLLSILAMLLVGALSMPLAAATDAASADPAAEPTVICGVILEMGVVPWTVCMAKTGFCVAWRITWGPTSPCPIV